MGENNINSNLKTILSGPFTPSITTTFKSSSISTQTARLSVKFDKNPKM